MYSYFALGGYGAKFMYVLYPAKHIIKDEFSGKLLIDGDLENNCILFRFLFDTREMVHPLIISIKALPVVLLKNSSEGQIEENEINLKLECNIPDFSNHVMKTRLFSPDFLLKEHRIRIMNIESQVSCCL
jgi:hypothetical protein